MYKYIMTVIESSAARNFKHTALISNIFNANLLFVPSSAQRLSVLCRKSSTFISKVDQKAFSDFTKYIKKLSDEISLLKTTSALKSFKWPTLLFDELGGKTGVAVKKLQSLVSVIEELHEKEDEINQFSSLIDDSKSSGDADFVSELINEMMNAKQQLINLQSTCIDELIEDKELHQCDGAVLEVRAGVGGEEAMFFAMELYDMYCNFCNKQGLEMIEVDSESDDGSGLLKASCIIPSADGFAYAMLRHEAGIHRVQRVPKTESRGRIHTSTASVAVIPKHDVSSFVINPNDIKKYFTTSPGAGGQHVNKTMSCALVRHIPTGIQIRCHATRVQLENLNRAMEQLRQILFKRTLDENLSHSNAIRAKQIKSRERSDKIRTYNFPNNRIVDHRIGKTIKGIDSVMSGGANFVSMLTELDNHCRNNDKVAVMQALFNEANIKFNNLI